jgi:hypothetical protein
VRILGPVLVLVVALFGTTLEAMADEPESEPARPEADNSSDEAPAGEGFWDRFKDPEDGKFDVTAGGSDEDAKGFLAIAIPFNEPAIGFGLAAAVAFFHPAKPLPEEVERDKAAPPTTSFAGGGYSRNGTWAAAVGHNHSFRGGKMRYLGSLGYADANLDFYGVGRDEERNDNSVPFNIAGFFTVQKFTYRIGKSRFFVGGEYTYAKVDVELETDEDLMVDDGDASDAGLSAFFNYDTRDTHFTPSRGTVVKTTLGFHAKALGGDFDYTRFGAAGFTYLPLAKERLVLGLRLDSSRAGDDAPFWALPFVQIRGVPVFRYLGNYVVTAEAEPRWKIDTRWSVLAFLGVGRAAPELDELDDAEPAYGYGVGFRYLLSRKLGLGAGIDLARGPEQSTYYIIVGNAWTF